MFSAIQTPMVRIHNRPAYNSECHATREMGVGELNNSYEDAQLADVHRRHRRQPVRDPDQLLPRPLGAQPAGRHGGQEEEVVPGRSRSAAAKVIFVDPRRTPTCRDLPSRSPARTTSCTWTSSRAPTSRCSTALFTYVVQQGWIDKDFIAKYTKGFDAAVQANR